ncbi:MAG: hypothetical protein ACFUZC_04605 [Chthoniobacteraceae bacterium]
MTLEDMLRAWDEDRYETARRIGFALLNEGISDKTEVLFALHDVLMKLADFHGARQLLEVHAEDLKEHTFQTQLRFAEGYRAINDEHIYRSSEERTRGYTVDEYQAKMRKLMERHLESARQYARTPEEKASIEAFSKALPPVRFSMASIYSEKPAPEVLNGCGCRVSGRVLREDGSQGADLEVTLGLQATTVEQPAPATFISHDLNFYPEIGPLSKITARTDASGRFVLKGVPRGMHEFLAVTLPSDEPGIATRFLRRELKIGGDLDLGNLQIKTWQSAPSRAVVSPHPASFTDSGVKWTKCAEWTLQNPFYYEFPKQLLLLPIPVASGSLRLVIQPHTNVPFQIVGEQIAFLTGLAPQTDQCIALYQTDAVVEPAVPSQPVCLKRPREGAWQLDSGVAGFRLAGENAPLDTPPLLAVRGIDGAWRGQGRFRLPAGVQVTGRTITVVEEGLSLATVEYSYTFNNGANWLLRMTALAGEPLLLAQERSSGMPNAAFEFSLREFSGGRGYLHWIHEVGSRLWITLEAKDEVVGMLPESVPWWIPPQGFGYAMTADGLDQRDYIGVFTRRRGEWIDRAFERIAQGPIDEEGNENRELDWPYPEMVGSSISRIDVHTARDGDAFYRFEFFDGERQWGLYASSFEKNDGPFKEFGRIQHAYSSPRLQEFKDWHFDVADTLARPHVVANHEELPLLRRKARSPRFSGLWKKIRSQQVPGSRDGLTFAVEGDPLLAWHKRTELLSVADVRSRMTLLGRDFSDIYSPVGGRHITALAEEYDLIAASGVFTEEEERRVRAFFILMGHMYMEEDFMNWRFNGRNANFEADRTDIISSIGLVFHGHPDASRFLEHVVERTERSLVAYCTPGSGKWYENPTCYYLHASKCRMNLVYHLGHKGVLDLDKVPRLKDFLRWGIHLLTPPQPIQYVLMRDGGNAEYRQSPKVRKVPPIGDHAGVGAWLPEHYAFIGKLFLKTDPAFGHELINAYFSANADGQRLMGLIPWENDGPETTPTAPHHAATLGNLPLFFSAIDEADLPNNPQIPLDSRRLEGFGAVFRNQVNTDQESYLLIKQGPGGYRYHRTEGSFLLFAQGRPLVYDGGEAGETWRHSTLSFHDVHMPLSSGRFERYFDRQGVQFAEGAHPVILQPGEPAFLSDNCHHKLVEECYRRFRLEPVAVVRSFAWVDDDYLIIHDDLTHSRPELSHWHLQVVGDAPVQSDDHRFRFPGRFGVDLEIVLPGQAFSEWKTEAVPIMHYQGTPRDWFTMQHLQMSKAHASNYLAAMRPVRSTDALRFEVEALKDQGEMIHGVRVVRDEGEDLLWFRRDGLSWSEDGIRFSGSFGGLLRRADRTRLLLMGKGVLKTPDASLSSNGPRAVLALTADGLQLEAEGEGAVTLNACGIQKTILVTPESPVVARISPRALTY